MRSQKTDPHFSSIYTIYVVYVGPAIYPELTQRSVAESGLLLLLFGNRRGIKQLSQLGGYVDLEWDRSPR